MPADEPRRESGETVDGEVAVPSHAMVSTCSRLLRIAQDPQLCQWSSMERAAAARAMSTSGDECSCCSRLRRAF